MSASGVWNSFVSNSSGRLDKGGPFSALIYMVKEKKLHKFHYVYRHFILKMWYRSFLIAHHWSLPFNTIYLIIIY